MSVKIADGDSIRNAIKGIISNLIDDNIEETEDEYPECICNIWNYIPTLFKDDQEKAYIDLLWLAVKTSYKNKLYQFAYMQYHMLFMSALYFVALKISWLHKEEFEKFIYYLSKGETGSFYASNNTRDGEIFFGSFALISESEFFLLLRTIGMDDNMFGRLKKLVITRNKYAHANGNMMIIAENTFTKKIEKYNGELEKIFGLLEKDIVNLYFKTITDPYFYDPDMRNYIDTDEQIVEGFIRINLLSKAEVNYLRKSNVSAYKEHEGFEEIKNLHYALCHYYDMINADDYTPINDGYYHYKYSDKGNEFIEQKLGISGYECEKYGDEFPLYECPECNEEQLVYDRETGKYHCFHCDADFSGEEISFCSECGKPMKNAESCICNECFNNKLSDE